MKICAHTLMVAAMAVVGPAAAHAAGPVNFGPLPGSFASNGAGCVGGNCPTGNCRNGECGLGGCPNGMCSAGNRYGQYGYQPLTSQTAFTGYGRPVANSAYYGTAARSSCPGGICPPSQTYSTGYAPRVPVGTCTTGNCPTAVPRYPTYQQPRFSFLGFRF